MNVKVSSWPFIQTMRGPVCSADSQQTFDECQAFHAQLVQQTVKMQTFEDPQTFHRFLD